MTPRSQQGQPGARLMNARVLAPSGASRAVFSALRSRAFEFALLAALVLASSLAGLNAVAPARAAPEGAGSRSAEAQHMEGRIHLTPAERDFVVTAQRVQRRFNDPHFLYPVSDHTRVPAGFPLQLAEAPVLLVSGTPVTWFVVPPLLDLLAAARLEGFNPRPVSGFRSIQDQARVFVEAVQKEMDQGASRAEAERLIMTFSARPGYSEHHLGLAIDLLDDTGAEWNEDWNAVRRAYAGGLYGWLRDHAHQFGFVLSYPTGSDPYTAKPGSGYETAEPWHIRYVGTVLADWFLQQGYLNPETEMTVNRMLERMAAWQGTDTQDAVNRLSP